MTNYISADLKRIFKRVPRLIVLAAVYAGFIIYLAASGAGKGRGSDYISLSNQYLANMLPLLFGVIELISVFWRISGRRRCRSPSAGAWSAGRWCCASSSSFASSWLSIC